MEYYVHHSHGRKQMANSSRVPEDSLEKDCFQKMCKVERNQQGMGKFLEVETKAIHSPLSSSTYEGHGKKLSAAARSIFLAGAFGRGRYPPTWLIREGAQEYVC